MIMFLLIIFYQFFLFFLLRLANFAIKIKKTIINELVRLGKSTISDIQKNSEELAEYSNQKLSALVKQLVDNGEVTKTVDKKKSYFEVVE